MMARFIVWIYKLLHRPVLIVTKCPEGMMVNGSVDNMTFGRSLEAILAAMKENTIEGKEKELGEGIVDLVKSVFNLNESEAA